MVTPAESEGIQPTMPDSLLPFEGADPSRATRQLPDPARLLDTVEPLQTAHLAPMGTRPSPAPVIERRALEVPPAGSPARTQEPPPTDAEKLSYLHRHLPWLAVMTVAGFASSLASQIAMEAITRAWVLTPFTAFGVVYGILSLAGSYAGRGDFDYGAHQARVRAWLPDQLPAVDIFLPVCGEAPDVLRNTWRHVSDLIDAYPGVAMAYVLDDGDSEYSRQMASDFGFNYSVRPDRGYLKKAGNLRHGFGISNGDFIVILDADFAPRPDFLRELLPYFDDGKIAIVQSPQWFRTSMSQPWLQRAAGSVQELFYRSIQVSRDKRDASICVGSCAIYRRAALAENGGTTLIEHSEDVHTGFDLRVLGWKLRYVPLPMAAGQCPSDFGSFVTQQYRWCSGSMSLLGSRKFWRARMPANSRVCYLAGFCYYIYTAVSVFIAPVIPAYLLIAAPQRISPSNFLVLTPALTAGWLMFPLWHKSHYGPSYWTLSIIRGWAHALALWDIARRKRMGWQVTGSGPKRGVRRAWYGIAVWNGGAGLALVSLCCWRMVTSGDGPTRFWVVTLLCLVYLGTVTWVYAPDRIAAWRPRLTAGWGLAAIMLLQAILSLKLLRSNTAFFDEALYLSTGHLEWAQWLHGYAGDSQALPALFSGAPVVYPPLGAVLDSFGGLTAARLLSLAFMLGATVLLYDVTRRLLDSRAAVSAALLFAVLAPTQALGAFAAFDPMAIGLLTLATWTGVVAASRRRLVSASALLLAAALVLALADATKYVTVLWTPAAAAVVAIAFWQRRRLRAGILAAAALTGAWAGCVGLGLHAAGGSYWTGIVGTTLHRYVSAYVAASVGQVLQHAVWYIWPVVLLAGAALVLALRSGTRTTRALCCCAVLAVLVAPAGQAYIHTYSSLWRHSDYGAWFGAIGAGYALACVSRLQWRPLWRTAVIVMVACGITMPGLLLSYAAGIAHQYRYVYPVRSAGSITEASDLYSWPAEGGMIRSLSFLRRPGPGLVLADEWASVRYYFHASVAPTQVSILTGMPLPELAADAAKGEFEVIEIGGIETSSPAEIRAEQTLVARSRHYRLIYKKPYYDQYGNKLNLQVWRKK